MRRPSGTTILSSAPKTPTRRSCATVYTCVEERNVGEIYQRLLLTDGRRVMAVSYQGERDILAFLPLFEAAMTE